MDFLGIFRDFDLALISKCMIVELAIGIVVGFILKQVAKISANRTSNLQVIPSNEYTSPHFAKNFPRHAFDIFQLPPEFVIVQSVSDQLISEDFYTSLGSSTKVRYENEEYRGYGYSALTAPVYLCTVVIPIVVGFFPALLPFIGKTFSPLLYSGMTWMFLSFLIQPLLGLLIQSPNSQE